MRVVHLITSLGRGGAEQMLFRILENGGAANQGIAVISMTAGGANGQKISNLGIPVFDLGMRQGTPSVRALWHFRKLINQLEPDIVHCWMYHANILGSVARLLHLIRVPIIWNIRHSVEDIQNEKAMTRFIIRLGIKLAHIPDRIIYNSSLAAKQHSALGYPSQKTIIIPNGFDCAQLKPNLAARQRLRTELDITSDKIAVIHVARFHPMKDHGNFLQATERLSQDSRYMFILVGPGVTLENPWFSARVRALDLNRYRLLGERNDVQDVYSAADISCLSSYGEGFPNVLGESMACGLPCVATDVGDSSYIIGDTGLIVPSRDPQALAKAIARIGAEAPKDRQARGELARQRIQQNFSLKAIVEQYTKLYDSVINKTRGG